MVNRDRDGDESASNLECESRVVHFNLLQLAGPLILSFIVQAIQQAKDSNSMPGRLRTGKEYSGLLYKAYHPSFMFPVGPLLIFVEKIVRLRC